MDSGITVSLLSCSGFEELLPDGLLELTRYSSEDGGELEGGVTLGLEEWRYEEGCCTNWLFRTDRNDSFEMLEEVEDLFEFWPLANWRNAAEAASAARLGGARSFCRELAVSLEFAVPSLGPEALLIEGGMMVYFPPSDPTHWLMHGRVYAFHQI